MRRRPTTAVIVNTYNWPWALERVLAGLNRQTDGEFEVVVGDDGSAPATKEMIDAFRPRARFPLQHVWQEDLGFRQPVAVNRAVLHTDAQLLCFLDQDTVPAASWIELYRECHRPGEFMAGGYCRLTQEETQAITLATIADGSFERLMNAERLRHVRSYHRANTWSRLLGMQNRPRLLGLNFAASRDLYVRVNGFDNWYTGWGKNDSDLRTRMRRSGAVGRSLWNRSFAFHLWHPVHPTKENKEKNQARYDRVRAGELPWRCEDGLARVADEQALHQGPAY